MLALVLDDELRLVDDYPAPTPAHGQALIRVIKAGICNTDLELVRGYHGFQGVLGHEFVGLVEQHPDPDWVGRRVVGEINLTCGECDTCLAGRHTHCPHRTVLGIAGHDGAFGEYLVLPTENLHPVPPDLPDDAAVFTEPLAAAFEILQQAHIHPTDRVVLLGDGKLGLLCAQVLALTRCNLTIIGRHAAKLQLAEQWGIATRLVPAEEDLPADLVREVDVVVECTGSPAGFDQALRLVRPRGTLVLKSTYHGRTHADMTAVVVDEITLVGSRCGPFAPALRLLNSGKVDVLSLIHARYPLTDALEALEHAARGGTLKVLLDVHETRTSGG
ncbi:MAG: 2-deoxy-scyllo-inosamine dehydrogenase [Anaerolineales bacterium]|nr:2-deoxy-scyllo-inosamine dehydrogenase [Anaerolineales bacterium]